MRRAPMLLRVTLLAILPLMFAAPSFAQKSDTPLKADLVKQFGDWLVRCFPVASPSPCDMFELLAQKKTGERVMGVSLAYLPKQDRYGMQISVPLGVALKSGVTIKTADYTSPLLHYRRCDQGGCYVEGLTDKSLVDALSHASKAEVTVASADGRPLDLALSLNGFGDAQGAMMGLARKRANETPPSAVPDKKKR